MYKPNGILIEDFRKFFFIKKQQNEFSFAEKSDGILAQAYSEYSVNVWHKNKSSFVDRFAQLAKNKGLHIKQNAVSKVRCKK